MSTDSSRSDAAARTPSEIEHTELRRRVAALRDRVITLWRRSEELAAEGQNMDAINRQVEDAHARYLEMSLALLALDHARAAEPRHG